ncbi:MAG: flagellar filament capping protein FliD [Bacillota bacterium]
MSVRSLRLGGLATGLDIDQMVKDLMRVERVPLDKLRQDRQVAAWRQEAFREINRALAAFRDQVFSLGLQATYLAKKAAASNAAAITVNPLPTAAEGLYELTVEQRANGVYLASGSSLNDEKDGSGNTRTLKEQFGLAEGTVISFALEGNAKDGEGNYIQASFHFDAGTKTIHDVVNEINRARLGFRAVYDSTNDRFVFMSPATGASQRMKVVSDEELTPGVRFLSGPGNLLQLPVDAPDGLKAYTGQDALVKLNGAAYNFSSNSFTLMGLQITINEGPDRLGEPAVRASISVSADTEAVFNAIKNFVEKYNELLEKVNDKLREQRHRDYRPLTEEQRKALTDKEIEMWEEKAKSGLLRNDPLLDSILGRLRTMANSPVEGMASGLNSLSAIGIRTGHYTEGGKLFLDEGRLKEALVKDPEGVMRLFTKRVESEGPEGRGIAFRLYDEVNAGLSRLSAHAGSPLPFSVFDQSNIGKEISRYDQRIRETEQRLQKKEDQYWRRFTALEKAIAKMNSQSAWLTAQFMNNAR